MKETRDKSADLWSGLALAGVGAYIVVQAWHWDYLGPEGPGAGFFPLWYGIAILALSLVLVWGTLRSRDAGGGGVDWRKAGRALAVWLALAASVAAFKLLGFALSFALLTFFIVAVMYRRPLRTAAWVAALSAAGFHLLFSVALGISLPAGVLGF
jgi:putative tricarboxylic transport membrane protein